MLYFSEKNFQVTCTLYIINVELNEIQLTWSFNNNSINYTADGGPFVIDDIVTVSLDLTIVEINVIDAGVYTCSSILTDALGIVANVSTEHTVFVQCEFNIGE